MHTYRHLILLPCIFQEVAVPNEEECQWKFWSEKCVSEDFDYSMRVQAKGYLGRYSTYTNDWLEGVSLTVHDEISRFKKYAYGSAEMLFNPIREWPWKGVISAVFWQYLKCKNVPIYGKYVFDSPDTLDPKVATGIRPLF